MDLVADAWVFDEAALRRRKSTRRVEAPRLGGSELTHDVIGEPAVPVELDREVEAPAASPLDERWDGRCIWLALREAGPARKRDEVMDKRREPRRKLPAPRQADERDFRPGEACTESPQGRHGAEHIAEPQRSKNGDLRASDRASQGIDPPRRDRTYRRRAASRSSLAVRSEK
jgi:hypothetical protein